MRCHLYAGQREQAGLRVPCRLMTLAVVDADATAAADDGDGPAPSSLPSPLCLLWEVGSTPADSSPAPSTMANAGPSGAAAAADTAPWTLDASGPAASGHRLRTSRVCCPSRRASSPRSNSAPQGEAAARRGSGRRRRRRVSASTHGRLPLRFIHCSLRPLHLDCLPPGRVPVATSLQRRSELVWGGARGRRRRPAWSLLAAHRVPAHPPRLAHALRASGARLAPAAAAARRGDLVALAVLRRVLLDGKRVDWWTLDVHRSQHLVVHAMRCAGARLGAASGGVTIAPTPARTEIVDLMGSGPDGEDAELPADGGGGAVAEAAAAAARRAGGSAGRGARERRPRALRRAGAAVGRGRRVGARAARQPGVAQPLPLLEDVTGRLNTEDDMTFCEVRLRSCHADDAPGSAAAASAAATAASSATAMTATAVVADANAHQFGVPNLSALAAVAAADEAAARLESSLTTRRCAGGRRTRSCAASTRRRLRRSRSPLVLRPPAGGELALRRPRRLRRHHRRLAPQRVLEAGAPGGAASAGVTAPGASSLSERPF